MRNLLITIALLMFSPFCGLVQNSFGDIHVYMYPRELSSQDWLSDGPQGESFGIDEDTMLIWVDMMPDADFAHPTVYVLISPGGVRVEQGQWWPELNDRRILYGEWNPVGVISPFEVTGKMGPGYVGVHFWLHELSPSDILTDGEGGDQIKISNNTQLVWIDYCPDSDFEHPTSYILIASDGVRVMRGVWWPVLNGRRILHGETNSISMSSPFVLSD